MRLAARVWPALATFGRSPVPATLPFPRARGRRRSAPRARTFGRLAARTTSFACSQRRMASQIFLSPVGTKRSVAYQASVRARADSGTACGLRLMLLLLPLLPGFPMPPSSLAAGD